MTRIVHETTAIYICDGDKVVAIDDEETLLEFEEAHAIATAPLSNDELPQSWYAVVHTGHPTMHFCDSDCMRRRLAYDWKKFQRKIQEELNADFEEELKSR